MKSASFSQCRRLTVITRREGITCGAIWDLDRVASRNRWEIELISDVNGVCWADRIKSSGTLIVWEKLDRLSGGYNHDHIKRAEAINQRIAHAERHLRLVFHRFMMLPKKPLKLVLNGRYLKPIDPFARNNTSTIRDPEDVIHLTSGDVVIQSVTLPHHKQMSQAEWDEIGGPEGHLKSQGFYLYRGHRLIIHGTWFGLCRQSELTKLSRVRVDIPNSMDAEWKIDVKKSFAQLPPLVRERFKTLLERISEGSRKTYRKRGQKLVDRDRLPLWHRVLVGDSVRYRPNVDHPALSAFAETLSDDKRDAFLNCISLVGASLPIEALHADIAGNAELVVPDEIEERALAQAVHSTMVRLLARGMKVDDISSMLKDIEPFRSSWETTQRLINEEIKLDLG